MYRSFSVALAAPLLLVSASAMTAFFAPAVRIDPMGWLLLGLAALRFCSLHQNRIVVSLPCSP